MVSYIRCLYSIAVLACFVSAVCATKCFNCDSDIDPRCLDFSGNLGYIDCDKAYHHVNGTELGCMKVVINSEQPNILRECYYGAESMIKYGCDLHRPYAKCHFCEVDLCNSSTITAPIVTAAALISIVIRLMS